MGKEIWTESQCERCEGTGKSKRQKKLNNKISALKVRA